MYICKDCGKKYAIRPEYCDCGNNTFIAEAESPSGSLVSNGISTEQKAQLLSWGFFIICILISLVVWIIPVKTQSVNEITSKEEAKTEIKTIPSIDKIWDDTPVVAPKTALKEEPVKVPETIQEKLIAKLNTAPVHPKETVTKPKEQVKPVQQKPVQQAKPAQQTKTVVQPPKQNTQKPVQQAKPVTQNKNVSQTTQSNITQTKPVQNTNKQPIVSEQKKPADQTPETPKPQEVKKSEPVQQKSAYNPNSQEMLRYKGNLRSAMFAKLPIGSIQGSGTCSVKFGIDSTGKLVNRNFVVKSDNTSLNNAVYYMMMSVPRFTPPPAGYNGETIIMNFKFNNGSYEISIY